MNLNKKSLVNYKANPLTTIERNQLSSSLNTNDIGLQIFDTDLKTNCFWDGTKYVFTPSDISPSGSINGKFLAETIDIASAPIVNTLITGTGQDNFGVLTPIYSGLYNSFGFFISQGYGSNMYIKYGVYDKNYNLVLSHVQQYASGITPGLYNVMLSQTYTITLTDMYYLVIY